MQMKILAHVRGVIAPLNAFTTSVLFISAVYLHGGTHTLIVLSTLHHMHRFITSTARVMTLRAITLVSPELTKTLEFAAKLTSSALILTHVSVRVHLIPRQFHAAAHHVVGAVHQPAENHLLIARREMCLEIQSLTVPLTSRTIGTRNRTMLAQLGVILSVSRLYSPGASVERATHHPVIASLAMVSHLASSHPSSATIRRVRASGAGTDSSWSSSSRPVSSHRYVHVLHVLHVLHVHVHVHVHLAQRDKKKLTPKCEMILYVRNVKKMYRVRT